MNKFCGFLLLFACSGPATSPRPAVEPAPEAREPVESAVPVRTAADACRQMFALEASHACGAIGATTTHRDCVDRLDEGERRTPEARRGAYATLYQCLVASDSCAALAACGAAHREARLAGCTSDGPLRFASPIPGAPTPSGRLAELDSSIGDPVEVCGVSGQREFLMFVECADGSSPFPRPREIFDARVGSFGPGGRCGATIDRYDVKCPEKTYEVYMDMYVCEPGERPF